MDRLELARTIIAGLVPFGRTVTMSQGVMTLFENHPWPGNIRQMHSVLRTAVALLGYDSEITVEHLPEDFMEQGSTLAGAPPLREPDAQRLLSPPQETSLENMEKNAIRDAVRECRGNMAAAARRLGISRNTLYRKMQALS